MNAITRFTFAVSMSTLSLVALANGLDRGGPVGPMAQIVLDVLGNPTLVAQRDEFKSKGFTEELPGSPTRLSEKCEPSPNPLSTPAHCISKYLVTVTFTKLKMTTTPSGLKVSAGIETIVLGGLVVVDNFAPANVVTPLDQARLESTANFLGAQ